MRQNEDLRFTVGYVALAPRAGERARICARLFYKDVSLIWRAASHFARSERENWIGKGDVRVIRDGAYDIEVSDESTTDLPLEVQDAFELHNRAAKLVRYDLDAVARVLRRGARPSDPRVRELHRAAPARAREPAQSRERRPADRALRARGRSRRRCASRAGFEPDFARGVLEHSEFDSSLYGGPVRRFRILSRNRAIQYLFMASPRHVWIIPPQATTTELSSFGVRTIDVAVDGDLCVPGWEYHGGADDLDQIPPGFAGERPPARPVARRRVAVARAAAGDPRLSPHGPARAVESPIGALRSDAASLRRRRSSPGGFRVAGGRAAGRRRGESRRARLRRRERRVHARVRADGRRRLLEPRRHRAAAHRRRAVRVEPRHRRDLALRHRDRSGRDPGGEDGPVLAERARLRRERRVALLRRPRRTSSPNRTTR